MSSYGAHFRAQKTLLYHLSQKNLLIHCNLSLDCLCGSTDWTVRQTRSERIQNSYELLITVQICPEALQNVYYKRQNLTELFSSFT